MFDHLSRALAPVALVLLTASCQQEPPPADEPPQTDRHAPAGRTGGEAPPEGRLPDTVVPQRYRLQLTIDPNRVTFAGATEIDVAISRATDGFWLHGDRLEIRRAELQTASGETVPLDYRQQTPFGLARVDAEKQLPAGEATLTIEYQAPFNDSLEGLYRVKSNGDYYAFTQFEATSARLAFPGFDEPAFKVPFDVTVVANPDHQVIANTPETGVEELGNGMLAHHFQTTRPLPTYLLAFAVGPLDVVEWQALPATGVRDRPLPLRGVAARGKGDQLHYALEHTRAIVESLEGYFQIPYPYAKLDIIAVPDFSAGAMENAGAITYREQLLLLDDKATAQRKFAYASVHAHELAHHWFGNLVTPVWWDDIWLNEAFATWMAAVALERMDPGGGYRRSMLGRSLNAMQVDSLASARRIRQPIASHHDIASAFDAITYRKGSGVLAMFERFLGAETFRRGIRDYLQQHAWSNATAADFIDTIAARAEAGQEDITAEAFLSFLNQPGVPLVDVELQCDAGITAQFRQQRYLPLGSGGDPEQLWLIPVCTRYGQGAAPAAGGGHACTLLQSTLSRLPMTTNTCPQWLHPNADGAGYYRFELADEQWQSLLEHTAALNVYEMLSLSDSFEAAWRAGNLALDTMLRQLPVFIRHADNEVAASLLPAVEEIYLEYAGDDARAELAAAIAPLYRQRLEKLGMQALAERSAAGLQEDLVAQLALVLPPGQLQSTLTGMALEYTGSAGSSPSKSAAVNLDLISIAMAAAARERGQAYVEHLRNLALASSNAVYRQRLLSAIGRYDTADLQPLVLGLALNPELRDNEIYYLLGPQFAQPATRTAAWQWLQQNLDAVLERIPVWRKGRIASLASGFCSEAMAAEVEAFFADRIDSLQGGPRALANTLESIRLCAARRQHYGPQLQALVTSESGLEFAD